MKLSTVWRWVLLGVLATSACGGAAAKPTDGGSTTGSGGMGGSGSGTGGGSGGGSQGGAGTSGGACAASGPTLTSLPACPAAATTSVNVPSGCAPTVDGTYHAGEWSDAACFGIGTDPVYVKYSGTTLYLAWPMKPTCGCGAQLAFNKTAATSLDGNQFDLSIVDDPFSTTGDAAELTSQGGSWKQSPGIDPGIVIANPAMQTTYELAIPFSELGITAGQAHTVGLGVSHSLGGVWPAALTTPTGMPQPSNPSDWGKLTSSASWR
jgi:hypothetical protein